MRAFARFSVDDILVCPHAFRLHLLLPQTAPGLYHRGVVQIIIWILNALSGSFVIIDKWQECLLAARQVGALSNAAAVSLVRFRQPYFFLPSSLVAAIALKTSSCKPATWRPD